MCVCTCVCEAIILRKRGKKVFEISGHGELHTVITAYGAQSGSVYRLTAELMLKSDPEQ